MHKYSNHVLQISFIVPKLMLVLAVEEIKMLSSDREQRVGGKIDMR